MNAVKDFDNTLFLQRDGSVLFRDRHTAPSTLVTCRRNAGGTWEYNASDYDAVFMYDEAVDGKFYLDGVLLDVPSPEARWVDINEVSSLVTKLHGSLFLTRFIHNIEKLKFLSLGA